MKKTLPLLAFLVVSIAFLHDDVWRIKIFLGQLAALLALTWVIFRCVHWSAALAFASSVFSTMWVYGFPLRPYRKIHPVGQLSLEALAMESMIFILLVTMPILFSKREHRKALKTGIGWLCLLDSFFVIAQWALGNDFIHRGGFFGNHSIGACLIACTFPFIEADMGRTLTNKIPLPYRAIVVKLFEPLTGIAPVAAVFLSGSSMAVGVLAVIVAAILFGEMRFRTALIGAVFCWVVILFPAYFLFKGTGGLIHDGDRVGVWAVEMKWWMANANHVFGTGQGTYFLLGPKIHTEAGLHANMSWWWLHSDLLQVLFEQGLVGLFAFLALFASVCVKTLKTGRSWLFAAACGYLAMSLGNYPARLMAHSIVMVTIVAIAFMDDPSRKSESDDTISFMNGGLSNA